MKCAARNFYGLLLIVGFLITAQAAMPADADKKDLKARFEKGIELLSQRHYSEARAVFDKNISEDPKSLASLLYAGIASNELYEHKKALEYFEKYKVFNTSDERMKLGMLRAYQALNMDKEAETLVAEVRQMKKSGLGKYLPIMNDFERERIKQPNGQSISVLEIFDQKPTRPAWKYLLLDTDLKPQRLVEIVEASESATAKARSIDPSMGEKSVYLLQESSIAKPGNYKIFKTLIGLPTYDAGRSLALDIFSGKLSPILESGPK